jgi:uncharacterized membrane protein YdjX (TVP38/TMEM64 family)
VADWADSLFAWVGGLGAWGPVLYAALYALATVLFVPGLILSIGAGIVFDVPTGMAVVFAGATVGATVAFLLGRTLMRDTVRRWMEVHPRMRAVDREIDRRGWLFAVLLRLSPAIPFNALNYGLGLTGLSLRGFWIGCLAMIPGIALYVGLGSALGGAALGADRERTAGEWTLLAVGLAATLAVTLWLARVALRRIPEDGQGA